MLYFKSLAQPASAEQEKLHKIEVIADDQELTSRPKIITIDKVQLYFLEISQHKGMYLLQASCAGMLSPSNLKNDIS